MTRRLGGGPSGDVAPRTAWPKGTSGNPGGRLRVTPEERESRRLAQALVLGAAPEAVRTLIELLGQDVGESTRSGAARAILQLCWPKGLEDVPQATALTDEELLREIDRRAESQREADATPAGGLGEPASSH